jgi:hypothetical protein
MGKKYSWLFLMALLPLVFVLGCGELGKVDQGRVIDFDKDKKTVTFIRDLKADIGKPEYTHLPPVVYTVPEDPGEMGPEPKSGYRMKLDTDKNVVVIFDKASQNFKTINYQMVEMKKNVAKDDPLVYDKQADKPKKFPIIDKEKKNITLYSGRQKLLVVFSVPEEYINLEPKTWDSGDEVRVYYHQDGKAQRLMNISKTDIFKK